MDTNYNKNSLDCIDTDGSSISLDTCETTPLSPQIMDRDCVDLSNTTRGKVHLVCDISEHSNMATTDSPRRPLKHGSWKWKISILVASIVFIVVLLITISFAMRYMQCSQEDKKKHLLQTYKSLFMTKGEMDDMMKKMTHNMMESFAPVKASHGSDRPKYKCKLVRSQEKNATDEPRVGASHSSGGPIFHGCCETRMTTEIFHFLHDKDGNRVRIVQFEHQFQVFFVETCTSTMPCSFPCACQQRERYVTALVTDSNLENPRLSKVMHPGICKCINGG
ncbi:hypothetical protein RRG08_021162 [Elysia crispata]|uniref:Spaetzle domain-containing protein n=1 Tax=Elysia crispata TaxID=231223 RepID=A0AAE0Z6V0_9GAST|nr:hypothetical protein RRG08_021162 [Elysia crispata]